MQLAELSAQIRQCKRCRLAQGRTLAVPGEGPENADIMFVGEAPGFHEDQQGRPFVGAAGQFLEELLASINLTRQRRLHRQRDQVPAAGQPRSAARRVGGLPALSRPQIALIKPKIIVTLGRFSMELAFSGVTISRVHGMPKKVGDIVYFPMFHPAAALHQPSIAALIEQDMLKIPEILADLQAVEPAKPRRRSRPSS